MASPLDPNQVRLTGDNAFIRYRKMASAPSTAPASTPSEEEQKAGAYRQVETAPLTTHASHWRTMLSPAGPGHTLFLLSELTDNQVRLYADNVGLARWLQEEVEGGISPEYTDPSLPVIEATFSRHGDLHSSYTEKIVSRDTEVTMTWYDFGEPFMLNIPPGSIPVRPHGCYSVFVPARGAQLGRVHTKRSASKMSANEMNPRKITSSFSKREKMRRNPFNRRNSLSISLRLLYISRSYSHG